SPSAPAPWDGPAPERAVRPEACALFPEEFEALGAPGRGEHIFAQIHHPWAWVEGRPRLSREIRDWTDRTLEFRLPEILERHASEDGSTKLVLGLADGERIEVVHMPREVRNPRVTLCISSQVGCAMGCAFCATGSMGIHRNLTAGEIVGQVLAVLRALGPEQPHAVTLVFMGMGEPLHNLNHVHRAVRIFNHPRGLNISTRRITVSTSGLVPGIERLARMEPRPWLALSLNATTDEGRSRIMPVNRAWNLARLRQALDAWPLATGEKLTIEYVLMAGLNDTPADAERLAAWMGELRRSHNLNLIRMNAHAACDIGEPDEAGVDAFVAHLKRLGCFVTVRKSRGRDVQGACGQLVKRG
ncbi:MAG TPA: 23S rRNA (adenine(2503)-C(2))-methyltransferase RlmN, partial [Holophaga sp.]|nr:23S rRNA (adenine(2503)-C(2))-methyltransferase RlmN [Holophaga sp.]